MVEEGNAADDRPGRNPGGDGAPSDDAPPSPLAKRQIYDAQATSARAGRISLSVAPNIESMRRRDPPRTASHLASVAHVSRAGIGSWLAALALAFAFATPAYTQMPGRLLPAGKLGELAGRQHAFPLVQIGGEVLRLSPGALIYDENNRTVVHGNLPQSASVLYVREPSGDVSRIYILRPGELEALRRAEKPSATFR